MNLKRLTKKGLCIFLSMLMVFTSIQFMPGKVFAEDTPVPVDGTTVDTPQMGETYYFDFQDNTSNIWDKGDAAEAAQGTQIKTGTMGLMTVVRTTGYHSKDHGIQGQAEFEFKVPGNCTIMVGGCSFTGPNDKFTVSSTTGTFDVAEKSGHTTNCYNPKTTDGSDRITFTYTGEAGTIKFVSPGSYIPRIEITSEKEDEGVIKYGNGLNVSNPVMGGTYYFDFTDTKSAIWDKDEATDAVQGTMMKTGTMGLITVDQTTNYHNDHGIAGAAQFTFKVAGNCMIKIGGCFFSGANDEFTVSSSTGTFDVTQKPAKTQSCYTNDKSTFVTFVYTGEAGTVTLKTTGGYLPRIEIVHEKEPEPFVARPIEVWDFAAKQESDTTLYHNNITADEWTKTGVVNADGTLNTDITKTVKFGSLTMCYENGDRLYGAVNDFTFNDYNQISYSDGYVSDGLWYCNGKGGNARRYVTIDNVRAGDKIIAYLGSHTVEVDEVHFLYKGADGTQDDTASIGNKVCNRYEFIAEYDGTYQIYVGATTNVKPVWHRIVQVPIAEVTGTIDTASTNIANYGVKFINGSTGKEIEAKVQDGAFTAYLTPGYSYTAVLTGVVGYGFTDDTKNVTVEDSSVLSGMSGVVLTVEEKDVAQLSGKVVGFESGYDLSNVKIVLEAAPDSQKENISFQINDDNTYSVYVETGVDYTITITGANDYDVTGDNVINLTANQTKDITVAKKTVYTVSGDFIGLKDGDSVTSLTFVNMDDKYEYSAAITGNSYSISLRNGTYEVKAEASGYDTLSHVIVKDKDVPRDLLFTTNSSVTLPLVKDIYVGCPEQANNYDTVRAAVAACKAMKPASEADRITVHIAPGVYREQVIIDTPYISFVNTNPEEEVLLTWYYGIGYVYYSIGSDGYYSEAAAFDKYEKNTAQKWGAATYIKGSATAFRAENITFEASFNKYLTEEEVADGVEPGGRDIKNYDRTAPNADVTSRNATERAAALAVEGNHSEFYNCKIVSSQDTLFTGNDSTSYFKNCFIDGNTDYIFGGGDFIFDACELSFYGYSDTEASGYITAATEAINSGYVFRNCLISANSNLKKTPGYLGRPWGQHATVAYINTKLESSTVLTPVGWNEMSVKPELANYKEFNTTILGGEKADTSKRTSGTVQTSNPFADIEAVFAGWTPVYYTKESSTVALEEALAIEGEAKSGETLEAVFSLGDNEGANVSTIQWYRVTEDGQETLVKTSLAYLDRTYTISADDKECYIKAVVTPETIGGTLGTAVDCTTESRVDVIEKADYTEVDAAIAEAEKLNAEDYVDFSKVTEAIEAVVRDLPKTEQSRVDAMAQAILDAIAALEEKPAVVEKADYTEVDAAIAEAEKLNAEDYVDFSKVTEAIEAVVRDLPKTEQSRVDAMAQAILDAITALEEKPVVVEKADYTEVDKAIAEAEKLNAEDYVNFSKVTEAINAVVRDLPKTEQSRVDAMAKAITDAIAALDKKPASIKIGDVDGDGDRDATDAILLRKYLAGMKNLDVTINEKACDVNGDGVIDVRDAILLLKHLAQLIDIDVLFGQKQGDFIKKEEISL
ncbi:MAG: hypothetical protein HFJ03_05755 [Lachnospira sp.]|nr:hypothetical protein [Lachnospira sp.]